MFSGLPPYEPRPTSAEWSFVAEIDELLGYSDNSARGVCLQVSEYSVRSSLQVQVQVWSTVHHSNTTFTQVSSKTSRLRLRTP